MTSEESVRAVEAAGSQAYVWAHFIYTRAHFSPWGF